MCVWKERERECVYVVERDRECMCVWKVRERECVFVCVCVFVEKECGSVCVCFWGIGWCRGRVCVYHLYALFINRVVELEVLHLFSLLMRSVFNLSLIHI